MKKQFFLATVIVLLTSCNHANHDDNHHHDETTFTLTAYIDSLELFAECTPFLLAESSEIIFHITSLNTFKPVHCDSVAVQLVVEKDLLTQTVVQPMATGLYKFNIQPTVEGTGKLGFVVALNGRKKCITMGDVTVFSDELDACQKAEKRAVKCATCVPFPKQQSWQSDFAIEQVRRELFGQIIKTVALIEPAQGDEIVVTAKTNGVVTFASNSVFEGKTVVVGQVICSVSGKDFADNNLSVRITEAKNNYEMTKLNYERAQSLVADKVVSEKELLVTKNAYENAKIVYNQLVENFDADGQRLKAPIDGFIKQIFVKNGGYVEAGQPIMIVAKDNYLMLRAEVRQKYASLLPNVHSAVIFNSVTQKKYTLEELQGAVVSYGKAATGGNFMIPVTLKIKNKGDFVVGSFVDVFLKVRSHTDAITVPNSALMEDQGIYYVFVQVTPELFDKQVVRVGATDGLRTEIVSGLTEEQRVVSKGAILIKLAQATGKLDAHSGHAH